MGVCSIIPFSNYVALVLFYVKTNVIFSVIKYFSSPRISYSHAKCLIRRKTWIETQQSMDYYIKNHISLVNFGRVVFIGITILIFEP